MFPAYNQPRMPRRCYHNQPRWQYWYWFGRPVARRSEPRQKVVYSGHPKAAIAVCLVFLGIFSIISGLFMTGFGYSYTYSTPLKIIGPVFLALGILMIGVGIILCILVSREFTPESEEASPAIEVESPGEQKPVSKPHPPKLPHLVMNNNGTSPLSSPTKLSSSSTPTSPCSPGNGISSPHPAVIVTPPPDTSSPKSPRLPFKPVGPAFAIADKHARAVSIERLNEIGSAKKKRMQPSNRHSSADVDIMARERRQQDAFKHLQNEKDALKSLQNEKT